VTITLAQAQRRRRTAYSEQAQHYEHRTECAIESLRHALSGCHSLARFLSDQQSPDWPHIYGLLESANHDFNNAGRWAKKASAYREVRVHPQRRRHSRT